MTNHEQSLKVVYKWRLKRLSCFEAKISFDVFCDVYSYLTLSY